MPRWIGENFNSPAIKVIGQIKWPVVQLLHMGWSHSIDIGQIFTSENDRQYALPSEGHLKGTTKWEEMVEFLYAI